MYRWIKTGFLFKLHGSMRATAMFWLKYQMIIVNDHKYQK
jgi:hypothetical protein